jgi:hypothetical protein
MCSRRLPDLGRRPLKLTVRGLAMFRVSVTQFRIVCIIAFVGLLLSQLPGFGLISFSD